jgi:hypothetical protein
MIYRNVAIQASSLALKPLFLWLTGAGRVAAATRRGLAESSAEVA